MSDTFTSHIDKKIFLTFLLKLYLYTFSLYENPSFIIKIPLSKIDRQHNGHKKKDKRTNNYLQNTTKKTKDRATRTPLKTRDQGRTQDFKLGGALKKIAPSGGRRENFWGILCEKSRFYPKKSYFFQFYGACPPPPPWIRPWGRI